MPLMVSLFPDYFLIQEIFSKRMIGKGKKLEDLYVFDTHDVNMSSNVSVTHVNTISAKLWHNRLGHLSNKCLNVLRSQLHFQDKYPSHDSCSIYPLAKQRQLSFVSHNHRSNLAFDLVHCEIWGPFHLNSHTSHRFFLTLVDDFSRFTWVFLLKQKSDVASIIPKFFHMIQTQFEKTIKVFKSNNAPELLFTDFFQ